MAKRFQIVWKWKAGQAPADDPDYKWRFVAHGARYDRAEAEETAALIRSHGKVTRLLPV